MAVADQTLLDAVDAAILAQLSGNWSQLSAQGRSVARLPLTDLRQMKRELEDRIATTNAGESGGGIALAQFGEAQ